MKIRDIVKRPAMVGGAAVMAVVLSSPSLVHAHHSFPATYMVDDQVSIEGQVVQFQFRNPHSFIQVLVQGPNGQSQRWALEWAGSGALTRQGVARDSLEPGDFVKATGNPGRNGNADHRMKLQQIERPSDGWEWSGSFK